MITEAIFSVLIDIIVWLTASVINLGTAPVSGTFSIPSPLILIVELSVSGFLAIYPGVFLWFAWRQIWGK